DRVRHPAPRLRGPRTGGGDADGGDHAEALGGPGAGPPPPSVRVPLGAQVLDPGRLRHDPGTRLGQPGLQRNQHRPGDPWGRLPPAGGRGAHPPAGLLPERPRPGRHRPPRRGAAWIAGTLAADPADRGRLRVSEPTRVGAVLPGVLAEVIDRANNRYDRWAEQVAQAGYCAHPIRLAGRVEQADRATGELRETYSTASEPDGTLLKALGTRRASRCPSCAATYQADAYQLTAAGLRGGKGVPETVAQHPRLFVTFTAPSFGPVHTRKTRGRRVLPCHPPPQGRTRVHRRRARRWPA